MDEGFVLARRLTAGLVGVILTLFCLVGSPAKQNVFNEDAGLNLVIATDVHMESNNIKRYKILTRCIKNIGVFSENADAVVAIGDNTMNGQIFELIPFYGMMEKINPVKPYYVAVGNHDVGNLEKNKAPYETLREREIRYLSTFVDSEINELYYSEELNGYHLIFMGPDSGESDYRNINEKQLDWLEGEIDKAAESGKPIFVFNHHPLSMIDDGAERYKNIVTKYENIFVVVGHMHYYINCYTVKGAYETPEIWVPCISMYEEDGSANEKTGLGYLLEVTDTDVNFKGVNYYTGELTKADYCFKIK